MGYQSSLIRVELRLPAALLALSALFSAGCAGPSGPSGSTASPGAAPNGTSPGGVYSLFHRPLQNPAGVAEVLRLHSKGVQIFRCENLQSGLRWAFRQPEAELIADDGTPVGRHGAKFSFEYADGSKLVSEVVDHVPSPNDDTLPWLLLSSHSYGKGVLAGVTYVQRIDTVGGMPPSSCEQAQLNKVLRVPFQADFVFYR